MLGANGTPEGRHPLRLEVLLLLVAAVGCNKAQVSPPLADSAASYVPASTWRAADGGAAGFDPVKMSALRSNVATGRYGTIDGLVVVRYGYVVHEQYGTGWSATRTHTMQSVSKSVTALLYGILSPRSDARLDRKVVDVLARYLPVANRSADKDSLTIRNLLTMRTSMDYWEQPYPDSPHDSLNRSKGDWTRFILDRRMTGQPGTKWAYNSGAAILTCSLIRELTGERVPDFARRELFTPLGITSNLWIVSPFDSLPHCGGGLNLSPPDLARIGYLVLRNGRWGDKQVVPESWIREMTQSYSPASSIFFGTGYGYFWWLFPETRGGSDKGIFAGSGSGGQWLFVIPSKDLVIAVTASDGDGVSLLYDVLAALR